MKKSISIILSMVLFFTMIPFSSSARYNGNTVYAVTGRLYNQMDTKWRSPAFEPVIVNGVTHYPSKEGVGGNTLYDGGCSIFSFCNAIYALNGNVADPVEVGWWGCSNKGFWPGYQGANPWQLYSNIEDGWGVKLGFTVLYSYRNGTASDALLKNTLQNGGVAVAHISGHFIALAGYNESNGTFLVIDSACMYGLPAYGWVAESKLKSGGSTVTAYMLLGNTFSNPATSGMAISGQTLPPSPHTLGKNFGVYGVISSNLPISLVWGGVYKSDWTVTAQYAEASPNTTSYNLHGYFNDKLIFDDLPVGSYHYLINATDSSGKKYELINHDFSVVDPNAKTYTVTYNGNGGTPSAKSMTVTYGSTYGDLATATRTGYKFVGWFTSASGGTQVTKSTKVTLTANQTLYAHWTANTYMVVFNANGGSGSMSNQTLTYDQAVNLTANAFTKTGYTFAGWNTKADASGSSYADKASVMNLATSGTVTLYARWTAGGYTISYNANGGSGTMKNLDLKYDQTANLTANSFTKTGYTFAGWNTKADESGTSYSDKASVKNLAAGGGSITLYAIWNPNTYTIKYDANTGSGSMDNSTMTYDKAANLRKNAYTKTGYSFESWSDGNGNYYADQASVKNLATSGTVTLWVKWKPNTYEVTLDDGSGKTTSINVTYDGKYSGLTDPVRDGYNFAGWYTEKDGKGTLISKDTTVKITAAQTLYANWSKEKIRITFNANGGTSEMSQKLVSYDTKYGVLPNAEKAGYDFGGWYLDEGFTQQITADSIVKITKNQEVYAKWVQIKLIVTFDPNGGTVDMETKKVVSGKVYGVLPEAEKDGFAFVGWFTEGGTEITSDSTVEFTDDTTVYAKWRLKGDVDADGDVDIDDVIMLQQWLLAVPDAILNDWRAGDLCQDERIDMYDLWLLKRLLIERNGDI